MGPLIEMPETAEHISGPVGRVLADAKAKMEARKMGNAVEIQTPSQMPVEQRAQVLTPMEMVGRALEKGFTADQLKTMMDFRDREEERNARKAFDAAISAAKAQIKPIVRNATGHNNKRYADFAAIAREIDPILSTHGLSYRFRTSQSDRVNVTCVLSHKDGHAEETTLAGPPDASGSKNAIQAIGSTLTYLQRYTLVAALGLAAANDDDGRAAGGAETISPEQVKTILALLDETNSDIEQFCKMGNIDAVPDMRAADFEPAVRLLNQKKAKLQRASA